jgi:DNA-binding CsgD family transcriptional regulator
LHRELVKMATAQAAVLHSFGSNLVANGGSANTSSPSSEREDSPEALASDDLLLRLPPNVLADVSRREREILRSLLAGKWVEDISQALGISPHTVRNHVKALYRKIGVHSQAELLSKFVGPTAA